MDNFTDNIHMREICGKLLDFETLVTFGQFLANGLACQHNQVLYKS